MEVHIIAPGEHQQLAATLLAALAQHPGNHPAMCRVGVVHALVDLLGSVGATEAVAGVAALTALRTMAATPGGEWSRHVQGAVGGSPGLCVEALMAPQCAQ